MGSTVSRRRVLRTSGLVFAPSFCGCIGRFWTPQQPYGDLVVRNEHDRAHRVTVVGHNHHVSSRDGREAGTTRLEVVVQAGEHVRESRYFVAGRTDVSVTVDGTLVERARVENWRGEGGDEDRHEESLEVAIDEAGSTRLTVDVTHTPPGG